MGAKNTVPVDIQGFNYLAKTVDVLVLMSQRIRSEQINKLTLELKETLFTYGIHRLSGGINLTEKPE